MIFIQFSCFTAPVPAHVFKKLMSTSLRFVHQAAALGLSAQTQIFTWWQQKCPGILLYSIETCLAIDQQLIALKFIQLTVVVL